MPGFECVKSEKIGEQAKLLNIDWFETSAKNGTNVSKCFETLATKILEKYNQQMESLKKIALSNTNEKKKRGCC